MVTDKPGSTLLASLIGTLVVAACAVLLSSCSVFEDLAPSRSTTANVRDWLVVPVFYVTDRVRNPDVKQIAFLEELNFKGRHYGVKNIVIPAPENTSIDAETMNRMGWQKIHLEKPLPDGQKPDIPAASKVADREMSGVEIINAMSQYRSDSASSELVVFVHGCCANFDTSLERAAKIAAHMQEPLVVYDWVSPKGFTRYLENETLAEESLDDFYDLLERIEAVWPPKYTTLIGHSMGAHFLDSVLVRRFERKTLTGELPRYKEIIFCNADIDAQSFINHNRQVAGNGQKTRVYVSPVDPRLKTSAMAHGNHARLGKPQDLLINLCKIDGQDAVDISDVGMGHEMPFWVVADLHRDGKLDGHPEFNLLRQGEHYFIVHKVDAASMTNINAAIADKQTCDCRN